jgi:hypothetical protein
MRSRFNVGVEDCVAIDPHVRAEQTEQLQIFDDVEPYGNAMISPVFNDRTTSGEPAASASSRAAT